MPLLLLHSVLPALPRPPPPTPSAVRDLKNFQYQQKEGGLALFEFLEGE